MIGHIATLFGFHDRRHPVQSITTIIFILGIDRIYMISHVVLHTTLGQSIPTAQFYF